jgi:hypothetical protein
MFEGKKGIVIIICAAVLVAVLGFFAYRSGNSTTGEPASNQKITFTTPKGNVQVNNFTLNPIRTTESTMLLADTPEYQIVYFTKDHTFLITISAQPALASRQHAEQAFLKKLNIDTAKACQLSVSLKVPYEVDPKLSGSDYGLSFCQH